jgi:FkbM family methyltransferase
VGCHKGEVLEEMLRYAPNGKHIAFEPIPAMFEDLQDKFGHQVQIHPFALSNETGDIEFHHVVTNPAYSGIRKRTYSGDETVSKIKVKQARLDDILSPETPVHVIKIDVEGAEYQVLTGSEQTLMRWKPVVIFENGLGASDHYGTTPEMIFQLFDRCGMAINLLDRHLNQQPALSLEAFQKQFYERLNYYFVATPKLS